MNFKLGADSRRRWRASAICRPVGHEPAPVPHPRQAVVRRCFHPKGLIICRWLPDALCWRMPACPQKITLGEMRSSGVRGLLVYCADYHCSHSIAISADRWPDHVRLSDLEPKFTCQACGHRGADVRPLFAVDRPSSGYPAHG
jgi:hypothetical protein